MIQIQGAPGGLGDEDINAREKLLISEATRDIQFSKPEQKERRVGIRGTSQVTTSQEERQSDQMLRMLLGSLARQNGSQSQKPLGAES